MAVVHVNYLPPPSQPIREYAASLYRRVGEGVSVQRATLDIQGWQPEPNLCHENVRSLAALGLGYRPVTGWLYFDLLYMFPYVRFTAHSVVENEASKLLDITPLPSQRQNAATYLFIRSELSHDDFHSIVYYLTEAHGAAHLDHLLR